jgi:aspartyl-tRNA(Asn)/glutamyl-tRNA(Gln) amidotransferase subunit A
MNELANLTLVEAADRVASGQATSLDLLHACWANLEAVNPQVNAIIWQEREAAESAARAADQAVRDRRKLGLLHGVPMAHKDMYYQAGKLSTCGSALRRDFRPAVTATVVARMAAAGAYTFAGLNMAEFAQNPTGHNKTFGDCHNPCNLPYITGGSSSGSLRRGALQLHGSGLRHRRIDPASRLRLRSNRTEADTDSRLPLRRHAALLLPR